MLKRTALKSSVCLGGPTVWEAGELKGTLAMACSVDGTCFGGMRTGISLGIWSFKRRNINSESSHKIVIIIIIKEKNDIARRACCDFLKIVIFS